jgi:membrane-associated protein
MGYTIFHSVRALVAEYGYWAVALALLCENAGLPVPGETTLLLASFLAFSEHRLQLGWIIVVGTCAAALGDNIGFVIGSRGGRPLLDRYRAFFRIEQSAVERGEKMFARYGSPTVFFARFIFGLRVFAGPLAGVLRMPWPSFALFNLLGAAFWVTVVASAGYFFGHHWRLLVNTLRRVDIAILVVAVSVGVYLWRRARRNNRFEG